MKSWIQSFTGQKIEPLALVPESIKIEDIAHALSNKCRFTGHVRHFYSVAQHCVEGSRRLSSAFQLPFLLHEVSEAYLPDIASPVKGHVRVVLPGCSEATISWKDLERQQAHTVLGALGFASLEPLIYSPEVSSMDLAMLVLEKNTLLGEPPEPWENMPEPAAGEISPRWERGAFVDGEPWLPAQAKAEFLKRFQELTTP